VSDRAIRQILPPLVLCVLVQRVILSKIPDSTHAPVGISGSDSKNTRQRCATASSITRMSRPVKASLSVRADEVTDPDPSPSPARSSLVLRDVNQRASQAISPTAGRGATRNRESGATLYDGVGRLDLLGLTVVSVCGMTQPVVYDSTAIYSVVARDFAVRISQGYAPAFRAAETALRLTGRFGVGIPTLGKSVGKMSVVWV
jgi:hypothetical protein